MGDKKRCLIVDDAAVMRMHLRNILNEKYEVVGEAENGEDAVTMFDALRPDLVTLDITMAVKNGKDALKEIIGRNPDARVIMVTAMGTTGNVMECLKAGARDFIRKPFDHDIILERVAEAFK